MSPTDGFLDQVNRIIPGEHITVMAQHARTCQICADPDLRKSVDLELAKGILTQGKIAGKYGLLQNAVRNHKKYLNQQLAVEPDKTPLSIVTYNEESKTHPVIPVGSARKLRNEVIPQLVDSLIAKAANPDSWSFTEGVNVLDSLIKLIRLIEFGGDGTATEGTDTRQLAVGMLSKLYGETRSDAERKEVLNLQRDLLGVLKKTESLQEKILDGQYRVIESGAT